MKIHVLTLNIFKDSEQKFTHLAEVHAANDEYEPLGAA